MKGTALLSPLTGEVRCTIKQRDEVLLNDVTPGQFLDREGRIDAGGRQRRRDGRRFLGARVHFDLSAMEELVNC